MRKNRDINPFDVIQILIIFIVISYFLLKLVLFVVTFIIASIIYFVYVLVRKNSEKSHKEVVQEVIDENKKKRENSPSYFNSISDVASDKENIQNNEIIKDNTYDDLNMYKTKYDYLFKEKIRARGIGYYLNNKLVDYRKLKVKCTCVSKGTEEYKTEIFIDKNKEYKRGKCTCPYYQNNEELCKHIYGLLLKYLIDEKINTSYSVSFDNLEDKSYLKKETTKNVLYAEIIEAIDNLEFLISQADSIYYDGEDDELDLDYIYLDLDIYKDKLQEYQNLTIRDISEKMLDSINEDIDDVTEIIDLLEEEIDDFETFEEVLNEDKDEDISQKKSLGTLYTLYKENEDSKIRRETEEYEEKRKSLKDVWGLSDYEADLVEEGRYNPWNFGNDLEDLEEDDYHYEDDL